MFLFSTGYHSNKTRFITNQGTCKNFKNIYKFQAILKLTIKSILLDCKWFKKLLFSTNSFAKMLSDSL